MPKTLKKLENSAQGEARRAQILSAAEEIFTKKGLLGASIAEIARKARVTDSLIYLYFKGKEDLLFSIPGERIREALESLEENLKGIRDPQSLLSKMIWLNLRYNETHPDYVRLLLLECRSHKNFYNSSAYGLVRKYAGAMARILEDGVRQGIFRANVDMRLVRDAILGTLDFEALGCLVTGETREASSDLDAILALVLPMIVRRPAWENQSADKQERILLAAEHVFARNGFVKAKVADVAKRANVAEGTVYEYFKNKEHLLLSIPEKRFKDYMNLLDETFQVRTPLRRLRRLIRNHYMLYLTHRDFLRVFLLEIQLSQRFYESGLYETFQRYFRVMEGVIEAGKEEGSFREEINPRVFRNLFLGAFSHMAIRWVVLGKLQETDIMREIDEVTDLLSMAVLTEEALAQSGIKPMPPG